MIQGRSSRAREARPPQAASRLATISTRLTVMGSARYSPEFCASVMSAGGDWTYLDEVRLHFGVERALLQLGVVCVNEGDDVVHMLLRGVHDDEVDDEEGGVEQEVEAADEH
jgi:hypothetical protein